jgi:hypothetical protein
MSSKRKHRASTSSAAVDKRPSSVKQEDDKQQEPESKKHKKDSVPSPFVPSTRANGGSLGGMGLYGELLPKTGYTPLPRETKKACDNLRQVMSAVKDMKSNGQQVMSV